MTDLSTGVLFGELDNTHENQFTGRLVVEGIPFGLTLELHGNPDVDLQRRRVRFEVGGAQTRIVTGFDPATIHPRQIGVTRAATYLEETDDGERLLVVEWHGPDGPTGFRVAPERVDVVEGPALPDRQHRGSLWSQILERREINERIDSWIERWRPIPQPYLGPRDSSIDGVLRLDRWHDGLSPPIEYSDIIDPAILEIPPHAPPADIRVAIKVILAQLARFSIQVIPRQHLSSEEVLDVLRYEVVPFGKVSPELPRTDAIHHFDLVERCPRCTEELEDLFETA